MLSLFHQCCLDCNNTWKPLEEILPVDGSYPEPEEDDDDDGHDEDHEEGDGDPDKGRRVHAQRIYWNYLLRVHHDLKNCAHNKYEG